MYEKNQSFKNYYVAQGLYGGCQKKSSVSRISLIRDPTDDYKYHVEDMTSNTEGIHCTKY